MPKITSEFLVMFPFHNLRLSNAYCNCSILVLLLVCLSFFMLLFFSFVSSFSRLNNNFNPFFTFTPSLFRFAHSMVIVTRIVRPFSFLPPFFYVFLVQFPLIPLIRERIFNLLWFFVKLSGFNLSDCHIFCVLLFFSNEMHFNLFFVNPS